MGKKARVRVKQVGGGGGGGNAAAAAAAAASLMQNPLQGLAPEQMMQWIQPKPDSNFQMIWPLSETFTMQFANKFAMIYPNYLDGTKTVAQGRRISQAQAVSSPSPTITDIQQALQVLQLRHVVQPYKGYSRDAESRWDNPGRVLVDLELYAQLNPIEEHVTKKTLLRELASIIVTLPSRMERLRKQEEEQQAALLVQQQQLQQAQAAATNVAQKKAITASGGTDAATAGGTSSSSNTTNNKKKKGKKKK